MIPVINGSFLSFQKNMAQFSSKLNQPNPVQKKKQKQKKDNTMERKVEKRD